MYNKSNAPERSTAWRVAGVDGDRHGGLRHRRCSSTAAPDGAPAAWPRPVRHQRAGARPRSLAIPQTAPMAVLLAWLAFSCESLTWAPAGVPSPADAGGGRRARFAAVLSYATILALPFVAAVLLARVAGTGVTLTVGGPTAPSPAPSNPGRGLDAGWHVMGQWPARFHCCCGWPRRSIRATPWCTPWHGAPFPWGLLAPATRPGLLNGLSRLAAGAAVPALRQLLGGDPTAYLGVCLRPRRHRWVYFVAKLAKVRWAGWRWSCRWVCRADPAWRSPRRS